MKELNKLVIKLTLLSLITIILMRLSDQKIIHDFFGDEYCTGNILKKTCEIGWAHNGYLHSNAYHYSASHWFSIILSLGIFIINIIIIVLECESSLKKNINS